MFWLRNMENNFSIHTPIWRPENEGRNLIMEKVRRLLLQFVFNNTMSPEIGNSFYDPLLCPCLFVCLI